MESDGMRQRFDSRDVATTEAIGRALAAGLGRDAVVLLDGDLGAGKTVLVRGLASGLGLDGASVQSPTFTIVHEHVEPGRSEPRLIHVDLYRLAPEDTDSIGIDELLAGPGMKAVEWSERLPAPPRDAVRIRLERSGLGTRTVTIDGGPALGEDVVTNRTRRRTGHE